MKDSWTSHNAIVKKQADKTTQLRTTAAFHERGKRTLTGHQKPRR